jgi:ABC-type oligopeptide transport system ATPase subunit
MALLEAKKLGISFGGLRAVDDFNISIEKGALYGLIGPNGAGKTTVFNLLTGVYKPTEGIITLDGKDITGKKTIDINQPILAEENIQDYFPVPADVVPKGDSFILNVRGESMINAGIFNGDRVFVHAQNTAHNGEIVVALIDDSATVKTFYKEKGHIRLQPENDTMDPIIVDDCQILGTVFGVFRFYR